MKPSRRFYFFSAIPSMSVSSENATSIILFTCYTFCQHFPCQQMPSQLPHARLAQVAPHTPPRRERDSDEQPPPPGVLTPQQVGQLSRMLGLFSGPGQPQLTAEQLFAYLRGVQNKWVFLKHLLLNGTCIYKFRVLA